tara:strand:+ start:5936 stop:7024 length:1089 start_codon:yes stop_codon:yes gene_type:complete
MNISLAEVGPTIDPTNIGTFQARISSESNALLPVYYTSPYASNEAGAFVAIPEEGVSILVCKPHGSSSWFYLGSTFLPQPKESTGALTVDNAQLTPLQIAAPTLTTCTGVPMRMQFTGTEGGGLHIIEEKNDRFINNKVVLESGLGKSVTLNDTPTQSCISLNSGNNATLKVTDDPQNFTEPSQAILLDSDGPQRFISSFGQTDILVKDGYELQLLNTSTGSKASEDFPAGNVNIQSKYKDVNVFTKANEGRIFIECLQASGANQIIEIQTHGTDGAIRIKTNGKVDISAENIDIEASSVINMKGATVNMEATNGDFNIKSSGTINVDGNQVQLNPTYNVPGAATDIGSTEDTYGGSGITTY